MRRSVKATAGLFAAALSTATCTAASASAATHPRIVAENNGPAYFKMIDPAIGTAIAVVTKSTTVDPGCSAAEAVGRQMANAFRADRAAISRDQNNPPAYRADLQHLMADLQSLQRRMNTAEARAKHQSVKARIAVMIGDLSTFSSSLLAAENGDMTQVRQMTAAASNAQSHDRAFRATCTAV
jgi:hypothetical protein